jgi:hypothetical protein
MNRETLWYKSAANPLWDINFFFLHKKNDIRLQVLHGVGTIKNVHGGQTCKQMYVTISYHVASNH